MIKNSEKEMRIACDEWLHAREQCISGMGAEHLDNYRAASERLFAAFIRDFQTNDFVLMAQAFRNFRGGLANTSDGLRAYPAWWPEKNLRAKT
jgi:hypothetical protein